MRKFIIFALAPLFLLFGAAAPAFASSGPNTVNVTVGQEIVISGLTDVIFNNVPGTLAQGCGVADTGCPGNGDKTESYNIVNNDTAGYKLTETAGSGQFTSTTTSATIPDAAWTISASNGGAPVVVHPTNSPTTVFTTAGVSAAGGDLYSEAWTLAIPANLPAAQYQNTLTYLAAGN